MHLKLHFKIIKVILVENEQVDGWEGDMEGVQQLQIVTPVSEYLYMQI